MANGKLHDQATKIISIGYTGTVGITAFLLNQQWKTGLFILAGFLGTQIQRIASPDVDVDGGYYGNHVMRRWVGNFLGKIYQIYWFPFTVFVEHRSIWSHGIIIGSLVRLVYLFFPVILITAFFHEKLFPLFLASYPFWIVFVIGFITADFGHLFMDSNLFSEWLE